MARTLRDLQTVARGVANHPAAELMRDPGLSLVNDVYRLVGRIFPWDELGTTRSVAITEKGREAYPWLGFSEFLHIEGVTVQSHGEDHWPRRVIHCNDDYRWERSHREGTGQPRYYRIAEEGGVARLHLRPMPAWAGLRVEVSGTAAPSALFAETSRTIFNLPEADVGLSCLVGGALVLHDGDESWAQRLVVEALRAFEAIGVPADEGVLMDGLELLVADLPANFRTSGPAAEDGPEDEAQTSAVALASS